MTDITQLIEALQAHKQADEEGIMCTVSRQAVLEAVEALRVMAQSPKTASIVSSEGPISLNPMHIAPKGKWIVLFNGFAGFWLSRWDEQKKCYPLYDWEPHLGVWYPSPVGWLPLSSRPQGVLFSPNTAASMDGGKHEQA